MMQREKFKDFGNTDARVDFSRVAHPITYPLTLSTQERAWRKHISKEVSPSLESALVAIVCNCSCYWGTVQLI